MCPISYSSITTDSSSGNVIVKVYSTTSVNLEFKTGTADPESSWSDYRNITFGLTGGKLKVLSDVVAPVPSDATNDIGDQPDIPSSSQPVPSSSDGGSTGIAVSTIAANSLIAPAAATSGFPTEPRVNTKQFREAALLKTGRWLDQDGKSWKIGNYPSYDNNCANFASQVLDASGWYLTSGNSFDVSNQTKWTYNLSGIAGATRTWSRARDLEVFARNTGAYTHLGNIWGASTGDLLFTDWDPNKKPDGTIDHVMVVNGRTSKGMPYISQKSNNRHDIPLSTSISLAKTNGYKSIVWYGLKHR